MVVQTEIPKADDPYRIFPVSHNWAQPFKFSLAFLTDIITSVNGKEQRRAVRSRPRFTAEMSGNLTGKSKLNFELLMTGWQNREVLVGLEHLVMVMTAPMAAEATTASVGHVPGGTPPWLTAGMTVILMHKEDNAIRETRVLASDAGSTSLSFSDFSETVFPAGSRIVPGFLAYMPQEQNSLRLTTLAGTADFKIDFVPKADPQPVPDGIGTPYYIGALELFPFRPNWRDGSEVNYAWPYEIVDFDYGRWANWQPITFPSRVYTFQYSKTSLAQAYEMMAFYQRHKGMRSEFFLPSWGNDIPYTTLAGGGLSILVAGEAFGHIYEDSTVFRRVMVRYTDGTVTYHQVEYVQPLPGTGSSVVRVIEPLPVIELTPQVVVGISWLMVARFAADRMDVEFLTNGVAEITLPIKTLENFEL